MQRRIGPNQVGYLGIQQPFADGLKLILKETILPTQSHAQYFLGAPFLFFFLSLINWLIIPLSSDIVLSELIGGGLLILIAISELAIYGVLFSGWAANSKYALQGSLRSTSQMISYSISMSQIFLVVIWTVGSVNLMDILSFQSTIPLVIPLLPIALLFLISAILECNRAPADQPEAESELVSGFMTEHSGISFAYFFLGEYSNMLFISTLYFILFFGVSLSLPFIFLFFWQRASLPRIRFDQQIYLGWLWILPFIMGYLMFLPAFQYTFQLI